MVSNGCVVRGVVTNSVLSPGVYVSPGAVVQNSVVMNDTWIGPGARLDKVVIDKQVVIGAGAVVGEGNLATVNEQMPDRLFAGITVVGKGAFHPDGAQHRTQRADQQRPRRSRFPKTRSWPTARPFELSWLIANG
jgi:glucose-1-phosphate adenylyltransferase